MSDKKKKKKKTNKITQTHKQTKTVNLIFSTLFVLANQLKQY